MHLYVVARGHVDRLNRWENDLSAKYLEYKAAAGILGTTGKKDEFGMLQLAVRPIRMYEIAFPEPALNNVLQYIQPQKSWQSNYNKYLWMMQKALALEKVPEVPKPDDRTNFLVRNNVECASIGIKKDKYERSNPVELI